MKERQIFTPTDKAIFDALNQSNVTSLDVRELFLRRGILISKETNRRTLADHFSQIPHDYYDYETLERIFGRSSRRERKSTIGIPASISDQVLEDSIRELTLNLSGEDVTVNHTSTQNGYQLNIQYRETDFNRSEFKQVRDRDASISIYLDGDSYILESNDNDHCIKWRNQLIDILEHEADEAVEQSAVELSHVESSEQINLFFNLLSKDFPGFDRVDVSHVFIFNPENIKRDEDSEDTSESRLGTRIDSASLKGEDILQAKALSNFFEQGFYISKIVWHAVMQGEDQTDKYEFEAQFNNPEERSQFAFMLKGIYKHRGVGIFAKNRMAVSTMEENQLSRKLYKHAHECMLRI